MTDSTQPSNLDYARFHGIANDYQAERLPKQHDDIIEPPFDFGKAHLTISKRLEEKLSISKAGTDLLSSVIKTAPLLDNAAVWEEIRPGIPEESQLKIIVHRLAIDNEEELLAIRREASLDKLVIDLPLEIVVEDNDESVRFPCYIKELPIELLEMATQEKIYCTAGAAGFLETVTDTSRPRKILEYVPMPDPELLFKVGHIHSLINKFLFTVTSSDLIGAKASNGEKIHYHAKDPNPAVIPFRQLSEDVTNTQTKASQDNEHANHKTRLKHRVSPLAKNFRSSLSLQFSAPESLSTFMSVRGRAKRRKSQQYPSFSSAKDVYLLEGSIEPEHKEPNPNQTMHENLTIEVELVETPAIDIDSGNLSLFVSATMLQSHRSLLHLLETAPGPPFLFFRDYTSLPPAPSFLNSSVDNNSGRNSGKWTLDFKNEIWVDADLTISPCAGILLTTLQETTQVYLPGHNPKLPWASVVLRSSLEERIYRACMKYEHLYVLVCHSVSDICGGKSTITVNQRVSESFQNLRAFCDSLSKESSVTAMIVPPLAESLAKWVFHLAAKHHYTAPWSRYSEESHEVTSAAHSLTGSYNPSQQPTACELSLRVFGFNSFAVWTIISISLDSSYAGAGIDAVSKFIDMDVDQRREAYGTILGDRCLSRMEKFLWRHYHAII